MVMKRKVDKEIPRPPSIKLRDYFGALAIQAIISRGDLDMDMIVMMVVIIMGMDMTLAAAANRAHHSTSNSLIRISSPPVT